MHILLSKITGNICKNVQVCILSLQKLFSYSIIKLLLLFNLYFAARTSSIATIDSLDDYTRYSDDGVRETDEKVAGTSGKQINIAYILCSC